MRFRENATIHLPADAVFALMAERVEVLVPHLPNVASIRTESRTSAGSLRTTTRRLWRALPGHLPRAFRPFMRPEMMQWIDTSVWDRGDYSETWTVEGAGPQDLYTCTGRNVFMPHPEAPHTHTMLSFGGTLEVDPAKVRGVPRIIGQRLKPQVEAFIINLITRNFKEVVDALRHFERAEQAASA